MPGGLYDLNWYHTSVEGFTEAVILSTYSSTITKKFIISTVLQSLLKINTVKLVKIVTFSGDRLRVNTGIIFYRY